MSDNNNSPKSGPEHVTGDLKFHYLKSQHFRVIHAEGGLGGISPKLNSIQMAVYSERGAIPQETVAKVVDGEVKEEKVTMTREGIVRELECQLVMSVSDAESIANWLLRHVEEAKRLREELKKK
jgi:hypothetical protein